MPKSKSLWLINIPERPVRVVMATNGFEALDKYCKVYYIKGPTKSRYQRPEYVRKVRLGDSIDPGAILS